MKIEAISTRSQKKEYEWLCVESSVHFDWNGCFCRKPFMYLIVWKDKYFSEKQYVIQVSVLDYDDYSVGCVYYPGQDRFTGVLHEVINWMNDLEHGVVDYGEYVKDYKEFFPDCECERELY